MFGRLTPRGATTLLHDATMAALTWCFAYWLRFNFDIPPYFLAGMKQTLTWIVPLQAVVFYFCGLYRGLWRYASVPDLQRIAFGALVAGCAVPILLQFLQLGVVVPRSVLLLQPILLVATMGGSRLAYRMWKEHAHYGAVRGRGKPVLVLGAGDAAAPVVKGLDRSGEWQVVGLLDDSRSKHGHLLQGVRVLGPLDRLGRYAAELGVEHAVIAMPSASLAERRRAIDLCAQAGVAVLTMPTVEDLVSGKVTLSQIRRVAVEDLLGRESVVLDSAGVRALLAGRVVLVTGAGGSIGAELCRQIATYRPGLLVLFELSEFALYRIEQELAESHPDIPLLAVAGDVKNAARVDQVIRRWKPAVLFHAAAYKHVPLMEQNNAWEAVQNNVLGTAVLARSAVEHEVGTFVLVSTDKAVNPVNVMGASKRLAEMVCQSLQGASSTRFAMVRFGNVLGSAGSVIPRFQEQIARGGPVTVTHPEIVRYFMSIPEAVRLVLQAAAMGSGGEIFVMDMGEPVKIVDLARDMIRLSGFSTDDIKIEFTSLRPGEKLFEELLADDEQTLPTPHPKLRVARAREVGAGFLEGVLAWLRQPAIQDDQEVRVGLKRWVPEYEPATKPRLQAVPGRSAGSG